MVDTKLLLKVNAENKGVIQPKWVHLCYVDTEVFEKFTELFGSREELNKYISTWFEKDFNKTLNMSSYEDLRALKDTLKSYYKDKYPELYRGSETDRQGWTRIWVTEKMKKEIEENGKES